MSQNTKLKEVALWLLKNKEKAVFDYVDLEHFYIRVSDVIELEKILGPDLLQRVRNKEMKQK